jgi:proline iminopeptidase
MCGNRTQMNYLRLGFLVVFSYQLAWAQTSAFIRHGDATIHYRVFGDGDPILIINGGPGMHSDGFSALAQTMGNTHKAIIFDQRGTGLSKLEPVNASTITLDLMIEDIERIRETLQIEQWVLLGHSFGGMLASYYATQHPDKVNGLILSSSGGIDMDLFSRLSITSRLTEQQRAGLNYWNEKIAEGDTSYHARLQRGKHLAPAYVYNPANQPIIAERLTQGNPTINRLVYQNMRAIDFDCAEGLKQLKAPVLIIQGTEDLVDKPTAVKAMNVFEDATFVLLERCNHYGWLDRPNAYFEQLNSFLNTLNTNTKRH